MNLTFPVTGDNYGGVDRFWFIHEDDISHLDTNGMIIPKEGAFWNLGKATKYTLDFSNPGQVKRGGTIYSPRLTGTVKKYRPELEAVLEQMRGERFALVIKDKNGYLVQVGRPNELLTFSADQATGGLPSDSNSYDLNFRGETTIKPIPYLLEIETDPETPTDPVTGAPVTITVNGQPSFTVPAGGTLAITTEFTLEYTIL
ncbi:hypothetical protein DN752_21020 [Echinicola strongylocentroti]|uniref:Uncharacterized protein n=1 Tax=Echinicola strongylocentroti TaxID=1795355 RepID=A0A2Z4INF8_9BACT|nr:hypothetical protein [Echinicola strongylocentroti]AWW32425.1 hypothetical protein DN752_21020 [Echinicola strongylocentroti]